MRASRRARATTPICCSRAPSGPALIAGRVGWYHRPLDVDAMQRRRADCSSATHDFSSFRAAECQAKSPVKTLARASRSRTTAPLVRFDFSANAFLHHMVRNIVGALVDVGAGKHDAGVDRASCSRRATARAAPPTFAADGLYFAGADYDARFGLPPTRARRRARCRR